MGPIWQEFFVRPILNLLVLIYSSLPLKDLGVAVIGVVIIIRLIMLPLSLRASHTQMVMQKLQPEVDEIKKKYKGDREKETLAILALYKDHKVNPFFGILVLLLQLPILIALYRVFTDIALNPTASFSMLWNFIPKPGKIEPVFLGILALDKPSMFIAILAALFQFYQTKLITPSLPAEYHKNHSMQVILSKQMLYLSPIITFGILSSLSSVVGLYWIVTSLWSILEYKLIVLPQFINNYGDGTKNKSKP
jgi:YidC/Oxa1 family membrane protein insertase